MSHLVQNPEDWFSRVMAHIATCLPLNDAVAMIVYIKVEYYTILDIHDLFFIFLQIVTKYFANDFLVNITYFHW